MYNTPPTVPNGDDTSLHLQFHSEISPSVSLPPRQSITQATKPRRTRSSGEAAFWNARAICTCQGKTVNSVHLPSGIWKPPPLFIKQQSTASPVTPRLQAPASRLSQGTTGSAPFAVTFPDSSLPPPPPMSLQAVLTLHRHLPMLLLGLSPREDVASTLAASLGSHPVPVPRALAPLLAFGFPAMQIFWYPKPNNPNAHRRAFPPNSISTGGPPSPMG